MYTSDDINIYKLYVESNTPIHPKVQEALDRIEIIDGRKVIQGNVDLIECGLKSLSFEGVHVTGDFICFNNQITSLEGAPSSVGGDFDCLNNQITSLEGAPSSVGGSFYCENNELTSLVGAPSSVGGNFSCSENKITSLVGAPISVGTDFFCCETQITSLEGAPKKVGGDFTCYDNERLTSLEGAPTSVVVFSFNDPITIKQVAAANIHAQKFLYASQDDMNGTLPYDMNRDEHNKEVTEQVKKERYNIRYNTALSNELSDVEDAINIADIDF